MDIVLLGFFAQLVIMYAFILFADYRKWASARSQGSVSKRLPLPQPSSVTLTLVHPKASVEDARRRA